MRIIILGSNGMLGFYLSHYLSQTHEIINITRNDLDAYECTIEDIERILLEKGLRESSLIINCIGLIPQAKENGVVIDNGHFIKINTLFPHLLANIACKYQVDMIHPTTDCVFNGNLGNYDEFSLHDEINLYGVSKSLGEPSNCTVIRTSIIGEERRNKRSLIEWIKSQKNTTIKGYTNHFWNGVTCLQFAKIVNKIVQDNLFWKGVRHIYSPNKVSKYEICKLINDVYKLNIKILPYECETKIDKSIQSKLGENSLFDIPTIQAQIIELNKYWKENNLDSL